MTLCATLSCTTSLAISLQKVGLLSDSLPGCSTLGGCAALTQSTFANVPLIGWSWSHVGTAWFAAIAVAAWTMPPGGSTAALRWATRFGAVASAYFLALMVYLHSLCPWCLGTHAGSIALWWIVARARSRDHASAPIAAASGDRRSIGSILAGIATAVLITVGLGVLEYRHADAMTRAARSDEAAMARAIAEATGGATGPATGPSGDSAQAGDASLPDRLRGRFRIGAADAPIRIVIFSDYECPDCRRIDGEVDAVVARGNVLVVPRHFPLCADCNRLVPRSLHPDACRRALIAEAAGALGGDEAFAKAHHALFALQGDAGDTPTDPVDAVLLATGLDRTALIDRMTSDPVRAAVAADIEDAVALGVTYTPMVFVNGHEWKWYRTSQSLADLVSRVSSQSLAVVAPPGASERLVDDWRAGSAIRSLDAEELQPFTLRDGPADGRKVPDVVVWLDYTISGTGILDRELAALAAEGIDFRLRVYQFPASDACNPMTGLGPGKPEACLASLIACAAGIVGGDAGYRAAHAWLVAHPDEISLEAIAPTFDSLPGGRAAVLAAFGDGRALDLTRRQAELLSKRIRVQSLPTLVVNGRVMPRWEHPGAPPREVLRELLRAAAAERSGQRGEVTKPDGLGG